MIFIGPTRLAGIGQHCSKYVDLFPDATYHVIGSEIPESEHGLLFTIPVAQTIKEIPYIKSRVKNLACMTAWRCRVSSARTCCRDSSLTRSSTSCTRTYHNRRCTRSIT